MKEFKNVCVYVGGGAAGKHINISGNLLILLGKHNRRKCRLKFNKIFVSYGVFVAPLWSLPGRITIST